MMLTEEWALGMFYHEVSEWEGDDDIGMYEYELGSQ